jgi:hypothetical protein
VDLGLAGMAGGSALRLAARWSRALIGGGELGMAVVGKQKIRPTQDAGKPGLRVRRFLGMSKIDKRQSPDWSGLRLHIFRQTVLRKDRQVDVK